MYEALQARDAAAKARGVMLIPGVGFDVVPTDCLALHLKRRLPAAARLRLAFQSVGPAGLPPGTQRTAIELLSYGDRVRRNGRLARPQSPGKTISVDFGDGPVTAQLAPWGDVFTAYYSTGIPNIEDYLVVPAAMQRQMAICQVIAPWARSARTDRGASGADPNARLGRGRRRPGRPCGIAAPRTGGGSGLDDDHGTGRRLQGSRRRRQAGYQSPASAFGEDFVLEGEGVTREDVV